MENNNIFISETFYSTRHGNKGIQINVELYQYHEVIFISSSTTTSCGREQTKY